MKITSYPVIILMFILGVSSGCSGRKSERASESEDEITRRLQMINPGLTDPGMLIGLIQDSGVPFSGGLTNGRERMDLYLSDSSLSAGNLGIYTVDIAYLLAYEKREQALDHLEAAQELARNIGVEHIYDEGMYQRYLAISNHPDSLLKLLSNAAQQVEKELSSRDFMRAATLFATGEFIEKLHITSHLLMSETGSNTDQKSFLLLVLLQQEESLDNLIILLDGIRGREEGERFMAYMKELKVVYQELNSQSELADMTVENITENPIYSDLRDLAGTISNRFINPEI